MRREHNQNKLVACIHDPEHIQIVLPHMRSEYLLMEMTE